MRILHYSHDHCGLNNLQRMIAAAERMAVEFPEVTQLLITESLQAHCLKLPRNTDYSKLMGRREPSRGGNQASSIPFPYRVIKSFCKNFIFDAIRSFKADIVLVQASQDVEEKFFLGMNDLQQKQIKTKLVFGNGDLENTAMVIRHTLARPYLDQTPSCTM